MGGKGSGFRLKKAAEPGENSRMIKHALEGMKKPRVDTKDVQAIEQRMMEYLTYCIDNDVAPSVAGCANWLGVGYHSLEAWRDGTYGTAGHQHAAQKFYIVLQDLWAQKMDNGSLNPVSGIYMSKVFYGYKETQEIVVSHQIQNQLSAADLIAESKRLPGADTLALPEGAQTIDADYRVIEKPIEYNPQKDKAEANDRKKQEIRERSIRRIERENARQREYNRRKRAEKKAAEQAAKEAAERAQQGDNSDGSGQMSLNLDS